MKNLQNKIPLEAIDLLDFAGSEHRNYLVSFGNNREEINLVTHIQELFKQALKMKDFAPSELAIPQLLVFIHYNFLHSITSFMRGHVGGAYAGLRSSIDAAFVAAFIIKDRNLQAAYFNRSAPFDKLNRHIKSLPRKGAEVNPLIPKLKTLYDMCSEHSHADINSFSHRFRVVDDNGKSSVNIGYFQLIEDAYELKATFLTLSQSFLPLLEIFSDFLINEKSIVGQEWLGEIRNIGSAVEERIILCKQRHPSILKSYIAD